MYMCMQVLLSEDVAMALDSQMTSHVGTAGIVKSSVLKECRLTPIPTPWFTPELLEEKGVFSARDSSQGYV